MAEGKPILSDADKTCTNCNIGFNQNDRQPRLLSCLHTFCTACLEQKHQAQSQGQITCPKCRQIQNFTGSIQTLPLDPVKVRLLEYHQIKQQEKFLCTECRDEPSEDPAAKSRCQRCKMYLCKDCTHVHKRHRLTKDHAIINIEQMSSQPLTSYGNGHFCTVHNAFLLEFYCSSCSCSCCASCTLQEHKGHTTSKTSEAAAVKQSDVESSLKDLQKHVLALRTAKTEGEKQELTLQKIRKESESEIHEMFERQEKALKERKVKVLKEYNDKISKQLTSARATVDGYEQTLDKMDSAISFYTQVKDKTDDVERLEMLPLIKTKFQTLNNEAKQQKMIVDKTIVEFISVNEDKVNSLIQSLGKVAEGGGKEAAASTMGAGSREFIDLGQSSRKPPATAEVSPRPRSALQLQPGQTLTIGQITVHFATADITKSTCDVIVSSTTKHMTNDCGVAQPIARAAGASLDQECRTSIRDTGPLLVAGVVVTTAGNMPSKHVLHAGRPTWTDYSDKATFMKDLFKTVLRCLCEASNLKAKSVAFPAIATGMSGVPQEECAKMYVRAIRIFSDSTTGVTLKEVHFIDINDRKTKMIREVFAKYHNTTIDANGEEANILAQYLKQGSAKKHLRRSTEKLKA